jgi:hypothetical protein
MVRHLRLITLDRLDQGFDLSLILEPGHPRDRTLGSRMHRHMLASRGRRQVLTRIAAGQRVKISASGKALSMA